MTEAGAVFHSSGKLIDANLPCCWSDFVAFNVLGKTDRQSALNVDVPPSALNAAFGFLDVSLQEGSIIRLFSDQR